MNVRESLKGRTSLNTKCSFIKLMFFISSKCLINFFFKRLFYVRLDRRVIEIQGSRTLTAN